MEFLRKVLKAKPVVSKPGAESKGVVPQVSIESKVTEKDLQTPEVKTCSGSDLSKDRPNHAKHSKVWIDNLVATAPSEVTFAISKEASPGFGRPFAYRPDESDEKYSKRVSISQGPLGEQIYTMTITLQVYNIYFYFDNELKADLCVEDDKWTFYDLSFVYAGRTDKEELCVLFCDYKLTKVEIRTPYDDVYARGGNKSLQAKATHFNHSDDWLASPSEWYVELGVGSWWTLTLQNPKPVGV